MKDVKRVDAYALFFLWSLSGFDFCPDLTKILTFCPFLQGKASNDVNIDAAGGARRRRESKSNTVANRKKSESSPWRQSYPTTSLSQGAHIDVFISFHSSP